MSDLQRDIERIDWLFREISGAITLHETEAWKRLKLRLTPDRERLACAIGGVILEYEYGRIPDSALDEAAAAAIAAMEGK